MNKYETALENIIVYPLKDDCEHSPCCECEAQCSFYKEKEHDYEVLKELVDKATPAKPINKIINCYGDRVLSCPHCKQPFDVLKRRIYKFNYCHYCGQRLDWSDKDEKSNFK